MASIVEQSLWVEEIYRIQSSDPICGGTDGAANIQPRQLACRLRWLLGMLGTQHSLEIGHRVTNEMIAEHAGIPAEKIQLDVGFDTLAEKHDSIEQALQQLSADVTTLAGPDGLRIEALGKALLSLWHSAAQPFDVEFFTGALTMRTIDTVYSLLSTVAGDDTVILETVEGISAGDFLLVSSDDGSNVELVQVKTILTPYRFLATKPLVTTRKSGKVCSTTWNTDAAPVEAQAGGVYLTRPVEVYRNTVNGTFVIRRDNGSTRLTVEYALCWNGVAGEWKRAEITRVEPEGEGLFDEYYSLVTESCGAVLIRVTNGGNTSVQVTHMAAFPTQTGSVTQVIPAPTVLEPSSDCTTDRMLLKSSAYYNAFRDKMSHVEFQLYDDDESQVLTKDLDETKLDGEWHNLDVGEGVYNVRCRQWSDVGDVSEWSKPVRVYVRVPGEFFGFEGAPHSHAFNDKDMISLDYDSIRFGFDGTSNTAGFGEALFRTHND